MSNMKMQKILQERLSWSKFGEAAKGIKCTYIADEVEIEFVSPKQEKESSYKPNGYWITLARNQGWSDSDIKDIMRAPDPEAVALKMYERMLNTDNAKLRMARDKHMAEYDRLRAEIATPAPEPVAPVLVPAPASAASSAAPAPAPVEAKSGLRARFSAKQTENKQNEAAAPAKTGIASRLKQIKQNNETLEQDSTLFVRNVPEDYTEQDIKNVLFNFNIARINIVRKSTGDDGVRLSSGSAFIVLGSREDAVACMEFLHGYRWCNVIASVDFSKPKV